jgi:ketol-acid reductoisomerase
MKVQYEILRKNGLSPSEAFNETVEEATQSIYPIIGERGLDGLLEAASTTAQVGAIEWANRFEEVLHPLFKDLIERVKDGTEVEKVLDVLSQPQALKNLKKEIQTVRDTELWKVGESIRRLRC